jgi:hypothetical protein
MIGPSINISEVCHINRCHDFSIKTLSQTTFSIMTLCIKAFFATLRNIQHIINLLVCWVSFFIYCYAECLYAECRYAECCYAECLGAHVTVTAWTKFSSKDETFAKFSTLDGAVCVLCTCAAMKQNGLT